MTRLTDSLIRTTYRVAYGIARCLWFVTRPKTTGALVAVWHDGRLLVIRNSYKSITTLPGGFVHRGESPGRAAARELAEEVGIVVSPDRLTYRGHHTGIVDFKRDTVHFFEVTMASEPVVAIDNREVVWGEFLTPPRLDTLPMSKQLRAYLEDRLTDPTASVE